MGKGYCDGHGTERSDVRSVGRDSNGDPDAPDLCFLCRREAARGRAYVRAEQRFVTTAELDARAADAEQARLEAAGHG